MPDIRLAVPSDLPAVAALIARLNAAPADQSLHCAARTAAALRATLSNPEDFPGGWHRSFAVATDANGGLLAVFGSQFDPEGTLGWLWGPWCAADALWATVAPALLRTLLACLPRSVHRIDAFLHVENRQGLRFLQANGFSPGPPTLLYVADRTGWTLPGKTTLLPALRPAHEVAFARLHADIFPVHGSTPAQLLLDGRDDEHAIFAAVDGLRLLGSVCVSVNHAPLEGFVDYLAVRSTARGHGIGSKLLQTALHWAFETRRLPQTALCVTQWRTDARRLYEKAGFSLQATGVAVRRLLQ